MLFAGRTFYGFADHQDALICITTDWDGEPDAALLRSEIGRFAGLFGLPPASIDARQGSP